jgi:hypothetical protein
MKNMVTYAVVAAALFFLLAPEGFSFKKAPTVDAGPMEMVFAFTAANEGDGGGVDVPVACECGGDGKEGDGTIVFPCKCMKDKGYCECPKETAPQEVVKEDVMPQTFLFTNLEWCKHCIVLDKRVFQPLRNNPALGYTFTTDPSNKTAHIVELEPGAHPELEAKYSRFLSRDKDGNLLVPAVVVAKGDKVYLHRAGGGMFNSEVDFTTTYNNIFRNQ